MRYYLAIDGQTYGPYPEEELASMVRDRRVSLTTLAVPEGADQWVPLSNLIAIQPAASLQLSSGPVRTAPHPRRAHPGMPVSKPRTGIITLVVLGVVVLLIGVAVMMALPAVKKATARARMAEDINNMRQVKLSLDSFAMDFDGQFPNEKTHADLMPDLPEPVSSKDYFRQLFISENAQSERVFWVKGASVCSKNPPDDKVSSSGKPDPDEILKEGDCGIAYALNQTNVFNPERVLMLSAYKAGTSEIDTRLYDRSVALVTHIDSSCKPVRLAPDGRLRDSDGADLLNDAKCWGGAPPVVVQADQRKAAVTDANPVSTAPLEKEDQKTAAEPVADRDEPPSGRASDAPPITATPDLDALGIAKEDLEGALEVDTMEQRGPEGEKLWYAPDSEEPFAGWVKKTNDNGRIQALYTLQRGRTDGPAPVWYGDGTLKLQRSFKEGLLQGPVVQWHQNGTKAMEARYKDGERDGPYVEWYPSGQKSEEGRYLEGAADGPWTFWHENGQKSMEGAYRNGELEGWWTDWFENGRKEEEGSYKEGKKHGPWTFWHENGRKKEEGAFKEGKRDGPWTGWSGSGTVRYEKRYQDPFTLEGATEIEKTSLAAIEELGGLVAYDPEFSVNLRRLGSRKITDDDLVHLAKLPKLEGLILEGDQITDAGLESLQGLSKLESLNLEGAGAITDGGLIRLRELPSLRRLVLDDTQVTDAGLAELKALPRLEHLGLWRSEVTDAGLARLGELPKLRSLSFMLNDKITDAGLIHLKSCAALQKLELEGSRFTDAGLAHLPGIPDLRWLKLMNSSITDAGLEHLKGCPKLDVVGLWATRITDAGLVHLKALRELKGLQLGYTKITDGGLEHLTGSTTLKWVGLQGTKTTEAGVQKLQAALPNCEVLHED